MFDCSVVAGDATRRGERTAEEHRRAQYVIYPIGGGLDAFHVQRLRRNRDAKRDQPVVPKEAEFNRALPRARGEYRASYLEITT
ncbi:hypothetical protein ANTRET_LOCUS3011 [Anthophora retusa]